MTGLVTDKQLMKELDIKDRKTVARMIRDGDLPAYTFGSHKSKIKGWHIDVIKAFNLARYELHKNIGQPDHVAG